MLSAAEAPWFCFPSSSNMTTLRREEKEPEGVQILTHPPICAREQRTREGAEVASRQR